MNFLVIGIVFTGTGWGVYEPKPDSPLSVELGLKFLLGIWPVIIIFIAIICLWKWPLTKARVEENRHLLQTLHAQKMEEI